MSSHQIIMKIFHFNPFSNGSDIKSCRFFWKSKTYQILNQKLWLLSPLEKIKTNLSNSLILFILLSVLFFLSHKLDILLHLFSWKFSYMKYTRTCRSLLPCFQDLLVSMKMAYMYCTFYLFHLLLFDIISYCNRCSNGSVP